jgi:hypothetical protein
MSRRLDSQTVRKTTRRSAPRRPAGLLPNCQFIDMLSGLRLTASAGLGDAADRNAHPTIVGLPGESFDAPIWSPFLGSSRSAASFQPVSWGRAFIVHRTELGAAARRRDDRESSVRLLLLVQDDGATAPGHTHASLRAARQTAARTLPDTSLSAPSAPATTTTYGIRAPGSRSCLVASDGAAISWTVIAEDASSAQAPVFPPTGPARTSHTASPTNPKQTVHARPTAPLPPTR